MPFRKSAIIGASGTSFRMKYRAHPGLWIFRLYRPSLGEFHGTNHVSEQHSSGWSRTSYDDGWILINEPVPDLFDVIITFLIIRFITCIERTT
jgi:hypothetical protein